MLKTVEMAMAINLQPVGYFISLTPLLLYSPSISIPVNWVALPLSFNVLLGNGGRNAYNDYICGG